MNNSKGYLVLEDGTYFEGTGIGNTGTVEGELVFNTSMTGYQEILTDPSYSGELINFTYPLIGNYGTNNTDWESKKVFTKGILVKELSENPSNHRMKYTLETFLKENGVTGLTGIDTRGVTRHLRYYGTLKAIISNDGTDLENLLKRVKEVKPLDGQNQVAEVSTKNPYILPGGERRIVVMDYGVKNNTLRRLQENGCTIIVLPATATYEEIIGYKPDGLMLSNGPGDPEGVSYTIPEIQKVLEQKIPVFGICMGHQLLAMALGAKTYKLKFGHRGGNHPVKDLLTGKVYITSQNHGYAVDKNTIPDSVEITHINLHDDTVEGIKHKELPFSSVQYHPESAPGPRDSSYFFEDFIKQVIEHER